MATHHEYPGRKVFLSTLVSFRISSFRFFTGGNGENRDEFYTKLCFLCYLL